MREIERASKGGEGGQRNNTVSPFERPSDTLKLECEGAGKIFETSQFKMTRRSNALLLLLLLLLLKWPSECVGPA